MFAQTSPTFSEVERLVYTYGTDKAIAILVLTILGSGAIAVMWAAIKGKIARDKAELQERIDKREQEREIAMRQLEAAEREAEASRKRTDEVIGYALHSRNGGETRWDDLEDTMRKGFEEAKARIDDLAEQLQSRPCLNPRRGDGTCPVEDREVVANEQR